MKEIAPKRCTLKLKFWKEGAEEDALEGIMPTDSLRAARTEFRRKIRALLPYDALSRNMQRDIVQREDIHPCRQNLLYFKAPVPQFDSFGIFEGQAIIASAYRLVLSFFGCALLDVNI